MTETPRQPQQSSRPAEQPEQSSATRQAGQPRHTSGESVPEVFGDGSTREQQQQKVKEAEGANAATKEFADAERKAREDVTG